MTDALTADALRAESCRPLGTDAALAPAPMAAQLSKLPGWAFVDDAIERTYAFADFDATIAFVNAVAAIANTEDHHPRMVVDYDRCTVRWSTHSARGITRNDFICAAKCDGIRGAESA